MFESIVRVLTPGRVESCKKFILRHLEENNGSMPDNMVYQACRQRHYARPTISAAIEDLREQGEITHPMIEGDYDSGRGFSIAVFGPRHYTLHGVDPYDVLAKRIKEDCAQ